MLPSVRERSSLWSPKCSGETTDSEASLVQEEVCHREMHSVWGCISVRSATGFIQKASHRCHPLFCGSVGCCGFLKELLAASPQLALTTAEQCAVTFLPGQHRRGQGQTTREAPGHLSRVHGALYFWEEARQASWSSVFGHHQNSSSLFCAVGHTQASPRQGCYLLW